MTQTLTQQDQPSQDPIAQQQAQAMVQNAVATADAACKLAGIPTYTELSQRIKAEHGSV